MRQVLLLITLFFVLTPAALSQSYELHWEDHGQVPQQRDQPQTEAPDNRPVAPPFVGTPRFTDITPMRGYRNRWLKPDVQNTYEVQLQAEAYFNHDIDAYHVVDVIELSVIRDGREEFRLIDNGASHRRLSVSLPNMQEGDAYRAKVFWVDGSYRTIESVINVYTDIRPIVDEPDFLAVPYW